VEEQETGPQEGDDAGLIDVLVETPMGSRVKYEWDEGRHAIRLDRRLVSAAVFPTDYGCLPGTRGADGERLDVLLLAREPTFPGCWVQARPIGVLWVAYGGEDGSATREAKIVAVPSGDPEWEAVRDVADLPPHQRETISQFFDVYKELEPGHTLSPDGYDDRRVAQEVIAASRRST
jgi:inorganic pyrophosphatase